MKFFDKAVKIRKLDTQSTKRKDTVQHTLKFGSLFIPSAFKDISLFFRGTNKFKDTLLGKPVKRILVKQSYIFLIWIHFLLKQRNVNSSLTDSDGSNEPTNQNNTRSHTKVLYPSFFIYPFKNYKTTIIRAPMAHKTYSQEQFMVRFYKLSVSFYIPVFSKNTEPDKPMLLNSVNKSIFFAHFLKRSIPYLGTNMIFLHKYTITFSTVDPTFFNLLIFKNSPVYSI